MMKMTMMNRIVRENKILGYKNVRLFFLIFYCVGFTGILLPSLNPLFVKLTPLALILSIIAIIIFHEAKLNSAFVFSFLTIYFLGYFIEVIGVNTGLIFGYYQYSGGLGIKLMGTPLFIGINWVMLIYSSSSVLNKLQLNTSIKILLGSLIMLSYDIILEQVAPMMDLWYWKDDKIPLQNYLAWFIVASVFHLIFHFFRVNTKNRIAPVILGIQFIFFFSLALYFNLAK